MIRSVAVSYTHLDVYKRQATFNRAIAELEPKVTALSQIIGDAIK